MIVLICGGRDFAGHAAWQHVRSALDTLHAERPMSQIIHGGATGADDLGGRWASDRSVPCRVFPADWAAHGRAAGPLRNQRMLDEGRPELVVAFPGRHGTADMVRRAERAGVRVLLPGSPQVFSRNPRNPAAPR